MRRRLVLIAACTGLLAVAAGAAVVQTRLASCLPIALLATDMLPQPVLATSRPDLILPDGWSGAAPGAQLRGPSVDGEGFDLDGDGRALQLIGIANWLETPPVAVTPGRTYCLSARALTDSEKRSTTRLRARFRWLDAEQRLLAEPASDWQPVALWHAGLRDWSAVRAAFTAPPGAATLRVALEPSSDDRLYLDALRIQPGGTPAAQQPAMMMPLAIEPWPGGARAALSFSFDWETAMGGLVHSRSVDDPYADQDPVARGLRMREGVTTTLALFRPYGIRATYFANGYNLLPGNAERRTFMGDPTFAWARSEPPYQWRTDHWAQTPWFAPDPYGTAASDPAWYFGDLVPLLQAEQQDIQSHTFSHLYAGFAAPDELRADAEAWLALAAEQGLPPPSALAFPWSGSAGMADASWDVLEDAGITAVTRTKGGQRQYQIVGLDDPACRPVPGHARILACPDFYLTPRSAPQALELLERIVATGGMIDLWAHTEEVTSPAQIAAWEQVVAEAARRRDAGELWIAPLAEIAAWQQQLADVRVKLVAPGDAAGQAPLKVSVVNQGKADLEGLTLRAPFAIGRVVIDGQPAGASQVRDDRLILELRSGQRVTVEVWPGQ